MTYQCFIYKCDELADFRVDFSLRGQNPMSYHVCEYHHPTVRDQMSYAPKYYVGVMSTRISSVEIVE